MAVRNDFTAGEVLAAADLNDTFASKLDLAGGKILQIVRATDGTDRSTTSTSYVDATISVTITPQKSDSAVLLIWSILGNASRANDNIEARFRITDNSNNAIAGAELGEYRIINYTAVGTRELGSTLLLIGYATPATTSATTYKGRFASNQSSQTTTIRNSNNTGQLYAIEVSA